MAELFLEIGTEEIPSGYIEPALRHMKKGLTEFFEKNRIHADAPTILGTPRRLALCFPGVDARQEDVVETQYGPSVNVAFDSQGQPTKAALGFARGKGVDVASLTRENTPKGAVVCARVEKKGQPTETILNEFMPRFLDGIPFPKRMRWENQKTAFARPVHWIVALFDGTPLNFQFAGVSAGNLSRGHRFLNPGEFTVEGFNQYLDQCERHSLVVDPEARKRRIVEQVQALAKEVNGAVEDEPDLLNEVNYLVEYPVAVRGDFAPQYLDLPKELLVITMKRHQKYFPVVAGDGKLLPHFITVSNMKPDGGDEIKRGNERVLKARLEDAVFFYNEDRKRPLQDFVEELKAVVFQKNLGTSHEKMTRFTALAKHLAENLCPDQTQAVQRASYLCKADLVSLMVYEFPELQGVMGKYYAAHSGEAPEVGLAIEEHYRPAFAGDALPSNPVGAVVSIADKMDTILGCIGVRLIPSGSEDPYGLRRHSLGILQIILDRGWQLSLDELIDFGIDGLKEKIKLAPDEIKSHVHDLFSQRFKTLLTGEEFPYDVIDAVLSTGIDSPVDVRNKVAALADLKQQPHFEPLAVAFRRVVSILTDEAAGEVDPNLLEDGPEKALYEEYRRLREPVESHMRDKEFSKALAAIAEIKGAVDNFFDGVMVMVKDDVLRKNRMRLLRQISLLFANLADFSKIILKKS